MDCKETRISGHALRRMFERSLNRNDILQVIENGEVITDYPDDRPYPSCLLLGFVAGQPVHVVVAREETSGRCFVVTAYRLDPARWSDDFKTRRQP